MLAWLLDSANAGALDKTIHPSGLFPTLTEGMEVGLCVSPYLWLVAFTFSGGLTVAHLSGVAGQIGRFGETAFRADHWCAGGISLLSTLLHFSFPCLQTHRRRKAMLTPRAVWRRALATTAK